MNITELRNKRAALWNTIPAFCQLLLHIEHAVRMVRQADIRDEDSDQL